MRTRRAAVVVALASASLWGVHCSSNSAPIIQRDAGPSGQMDATVQPEAGPPVSQDAGPISRCDPTALYTPLSWKPPTPFANACTADQISAYVACFMGTGDCTPFREANPSCAACLETDVGASQYGPVVTQHVTDTITYREVNYGGCVASFDGDPAALSCGDTLNIKEDCLLYDCSGCADFSFLDAGLDADAASPNPLTSKCETTALTLGLTAKIQDGGARVGCPGVEAACASEPTEGGVAAPCGTSFEGLFTLWCGGGGIVADAGGDAGMAGDAGGDAGMRGDAGGD